MFNDFLKSCYLVFERARERFLAIGDNIENRLSSWCCRGIIHADRHKQPLTVLITQLSLANITSKHKNSCPKCLLLNITIHKVTAMV